MLRFLTCGESHGQALMATLDGMPAGLPIDLDKINQELARRQQGYGRGNRQKIEKDAVEIMGGVRHGTTTGAPIGLIIRNRDWENWKHVMSVANVGFTEPSAAQQLEKKQIERFRPGHADLAGTLKYRQKDIRDVLERASARETAARTAVGAICQQLLFGLGISITGHVVQVGSVKSNANIDALSIFKLDKLVAQSALFCADADATEAMIGEIKAAWQEGDSLGGVVEVLADGLPVGLGSYTQWDRRIDGRLAQALMSIQAMKGVEIGDGFAAASRLGSQVHDALYPDESTVMLPFKRKTNRAGGVEGGMTNGSRLVVRAYMKPIPTMRKGLESLSFPGFKADRAHYERSDVCAIAAASIVCKAMVSFVLADLLTDKFGGDSFTDIKRAYEEYQAYCRKPQTVGRQYFSETKSPPEPVEEPAGNEDAAGEF